MRNIKRVVWGLVDGKRIRLDGLSNKQMKRLRENHKVITELKGVMY